MSAGDSIATKVKGMRTCDQDCLCTTSARLTALIKASAEIDGALWAWKVSPIAAAKLPKLPLDDCNVRVG